MIVLLRSIVFKIYNHNTRLTRTVVIEYIIATGSIFRSKEDDEDEIGFENEYGEENAITSAQEAAGTRLSEVYRDNDGIEDACDASIFVRVSDRRREKENEHNGNNKYEENQEIGDDLNSKKELSKQIDEVSQVLERIIPIKVVLPPTKEENSRCKGIIFTFYRKNI